jgi:hypothetical protein
LLTRPPIKTNSLQRHAHSHLLPSPSSPLVHLHSPPAPGGVIGQPPTRAAAAPISRASPFPSAAEVRSDATTPTEQQLGGGCGLVEGFRRVLRDGGGSDERVQGLRRPSQGFRRETGMCRGCGLVGGFRRETACAGTAGSRGIPTNRRWTTREAAAVGDR